MNYNVLKRPSPSVSTVFFNGLSRIDFFHAEEWDYFNGYFDSIQFTLMIRLRILDELQL